VVNMRPPRLHSQPRSRIQARQIRETPPIAGDAVCMERPVTREARGSPQGVTFTPKA